MTISTKAGVSIFKITVPRSIWQQMQEEVTRLFPQEACGLLGGHRSGSHIQVSFHYPIQNSLHSPVRFQMDPIQQLHAFNDLDQQKLEMVAIYHSHPSGPGSPSKSDRVEDCYPQTVKLIWSYENGTWNCGAFMIKGGKITPVAIVLDEKIAGTS